MCSDLMCSVTSWSLGSRGRSQSEVISNMRWKIEIQNTWFYLHGFVRGWRQWLDSSQLLATSEQDHFSIAGREKITRPFHLYTYFTTSQSKLISSGTCVSESPFPSSPFSSKDLWLLFRIFQWPNVPALVFWDQFPVAQNDDSPEAERWCTWVVALISYML